MGEYIIGVDNGGTFIKAALYDCDGKQIALVKEPGEIINPQPGFVELNLERLWQINCTCIREVIKKSGVDPAEISCIGFAGQGKGVYAVDSEGKVFRNAITSSDTRSWRYVENWIKDGTADKVFNLSCQGIFTSHPVSILAWLKDNELENYKKIRWLFSMKDYLIYRLTGEIVADYCNQSGGNFVNLNTGVYDPEILKLLGIPEIFDKLPPLKNPSDICGQVTEEAAKETGCKPGARVIVGMFDVDASAIALGLVSPNEFCIITGTCGINAYISEAPIMNKTVMMNSIYCISGYYFIEEGASTSAGNLEWAIKILYSEESKIAKKEGVNLYSRLDETVAKIEPEESDIVFLPFLNGSDDSSQSKGVWLGMSTVHTKEDMLRAVYEGVVFAHRIHFDKLLKNRPCPAAIRLAGGAVHSDVWVQMFADVFQVPIELVSGGERGTQGVAMAASIAMGYHKDYQAVVAKWIKVKKTFTPRVEKKEIYEKKYRKFKAAIGQVHELWIME
jgi:L-xylulokinase